MSKKRPKAWGLFLPEQAAGPQQTARQMEFAWLKFKADIGPGFSPAQMDGDGQLIMVVMRASTFATVRPLLFPDSPAKEPTT